MKLSDQFKVSIAVDIIFSIETTGRSLVSLRVRIVFVNPESHIPTGGRNESAVFVHAGASEAGHRGRQGSNRVQFKYVIWA